MKIVVNGINAGLRFSSAHIIPVHSSCGFIHGHSYFVDVEIEGKRSGEYEFVVDFKDVKNVVRSICKKLDHRVLIPINNKNMMFKGISNSEKNVDSEDYVDSSELSVLDFCNNDYVEFSVGNKEYKFPMEDCVLLPLKHSSAEELSQYFANIVFEDLRKKGYEVDFVSVCVNEGIGQGAFFKRE
ncbi:6-pyruvoyl tetrahydropterin synthase family protein [Methanobrevibacter sp. TMH8]|uniref:6-carboxytetrahydropterin synthase n=1 Tax=Methanobrevibacter sp. TMH8 TaxID=2848611 RepID=UPI001CCFA576|nr:6-pyruvoyl tetrahydropterin synthase family protein [Methanobrevibacter sp. TMH8]MBZ9571407.1 6-pyruvoyl tetrahydropterin synthase family protein [Methanobrevibacter sp. TMH8]